MALEAAADPAVDRVLHLDWMRTIAVYLVAIVHTALSVGRVAQYSYDALRLQSSAIRGLIQFGMPFFFYLSGAAACLSRPEPFPIFLWKKTLRLAIPCVIGLLVIVLPTAYIGRKYRPCAARHIDVFAEFAHDFFANQFTCGGFEWLWFLPVSLLLAVVNFPLFATIRSIYNAENSALFSVPSLLFDATWMMFIMTLACIVTLKFDISLAQVCLMLCPYMVAVPIFRSLPLFRRFNLVFILMLTCTVVPSVALAYNRRAIPLPDIVVGIVFYNLFYIEGFINRLLNDEYAFHKQSLLCRISMPGQMLLTILLIPLCFPSDTRGIGYLFSYPLYSSDSVRCGLFVFGTWNMIRLICALGQAYYDQVFDPVFFHHGTRSSLIVYLFHWLYIDLIQVLVVIPNDLAPMPAFCLVYAFSILLCLLTYTIIIRIPGLCYAFGLSSSLSHYRITESSPTTPIYTKSFSGYEVGPSRIILDVTDIISPRSNEKSEASASSVSLKSVS